MATRPPQPNPIGEVYLAGAMLGTRHRTRRLIALGISDPALLEPFYRTAGVGVLVPPRQVPALRKPLKFAELVEWDPAAGQALPMPGGVLVNSILICDLGALDSPANALRALAPAASAAPATIIIGGPVGYAADDPAACHIRPVDDLRVQLAAAGIVPTFAGLVGSGAARRAIAIVDSIVGPYLAPAPPEFRVVAIICAYNEEDVIGPAIEGLIDQGVDVREVPARQRTYRHHPSRGHQGQARTRQELRRRDQAG